MRVLTVASLVVCAGLVGQHQLGAQDVPPSTPAQAKAWLSERQIKESPSEFAIYLMAASESNVGVVRALLLAGVSPKLPTFDDRLYPLTVLVRSCQGAERAAEAAKALLEAGADPNQQEKADGGITPLMGAVACPEVLVAMLWTKPDLNVTDDKGWTVAHHAFMSVDPPREMPLWTLVAHGFDFKRWRPSLAKEFSSADDRALLDKLVAGLPGPLALAR
jgi:ankyrin repeat protein